MKNESFLKTNENDLILVRNKVLDYADKNFKHLKIYAIILYGGACRYYLNFPNSRLNDYDVNLFLISETSEKNVSTRGKPKHIGRFKSCF